MAEVAQLERELIEYTEQLDTVKQTIESDPDNAELVNLRAELEEVIALTTTAIADFKPAASKATGRTNDAPATHEIATTFAVNDTVLAKWKSGDKSFYPARITSITGSSSKPVYTVSFSSYDTTETLTASEMKPLSEQDIKKRKFETPPAPASVDTKLALTAKKEPSKVNDGPPRPPKIQRQVKAKKELEAGKSKWQEFSVKGKTGKISKKESMFRTPDGVNARVGFVGSGQEMRKDPARSKHIYQLGKDDD